MDPDSWILLLIFGVLVLLSAYFSASESSLLAANAIRLKNAAAEGNKNAKIAVRLMERYDRMLTTILIGNNLCNLGCASVATMFAIRLFTQLRGGDVEDIATTAASLGTTAVLFCFGEMLPKSLAREHADGLFLRLAPSLRLMSFLLSPFVFMFSWISALLRHIFGAGTEPTVTEEELSTLIETIEEEGVIDEDQSELLQSALEFSKTYVADVLTLRDDVVYLDVSMSNREIADRIIQSRHSRLPVCKGDLDHVVGVLVIRDFLKRYVKDPNVKVESLLRQPYYVSLDSTIDDLFSEMSHNRFYMAIVKDQNENTAGIVTIEDFLEELVGEIFDEDDVVDDTFMKLGGNHFEVSGACVLGEMFRRMRYIPEKPLPTTMPVHVWVLERLGHEPEEEEEFTWEDLEVTVSSVEEGKLRKVIVKWNIPELEIAPPEEDEDEAQEKGGNE